MWGFNPDEKHTFLSEGDVISVPTWIYRAFRNVGVDDGFLFSGLGRDDTGGILWGPWTIEQARQAGVYLTEDYRMIDTRRGDVLPSDVRLLAPMTAEQIAALEDWTPERMLHRVVRFSDLRWSGHGSGQSGHPPCGKCPWDVHRMASHTCWRQSGLVPHATQTGLGAQERPGPLGDSGR